MMDYFVMPIGLCMLTYTELKCKWLCVWCDGWKANQIYNTCNNSTQTRSNAHSTITNRMIHVIDMHIFIIDYIKRCIMPLNFVQPMTHIGSLNNKISYGKS